MVVLNVTYKCKTGMREEFLKAIMAEGIGAACQAEAGNFKYDYYRSVDDDDELLLVEKWQDAVEFIMAGADAVQIGSATFANPNVALEVAEGLRRFMKTHGYHNLKEMKGIAQVK